MTLFRSGTIIFIASMVGNISNYLFQFFMGRNLSLEDFGAMNAVFSVMVVTSIPTATIMLVIAKYVSQFKAEGEEAKIYSLYKNTLKKMVFLGVLFFLPFLILNTPITEYLKIDNGMPVLMIGIGLFLSFAMTSNLGMLQGLKKFYYFGVGMGMIGFFKLVLGIILVLLGFGLNGAVASAAIAVLLVFSVTTIPLAKYLKNKERVEKQTREILNYSVPVLFSSIAFALLTNVDLILVKHIFSPEEAGLYSSVSILGKTVLYLPAAFVLALFPMVSESHALNHDIYRILDKGLIYTAAIAITGVFAFILFPGFALKILFGEKFVSIAPLLKYYGLAMMFMSLLNVLMNFNLARHKSGFVYTLGCGCLMLVLLINTYNHTLLSVIASVVVVSFLLVLINLGMVYRDRFASNHFSDAEIEVV